MTNTNFHGKNVPQKFSHKSNNSSFWIILISVLFFIFLVFSKWNKIETYFGFGTERTSVDSEFLKGEELSVEGVISQDGDFITHTHKLNTLSSGVFGLKSRTINLNQYSGNILIEGMIDGQNQGIYIIEVIEVISASLDDNLVDDQENLSGSDGLYISKAGIYFTDKFFDNYDIVSTGEKDKIKIKSLENDSLIVLDYFLCNSSDRNRDCKNLSSTFSNSSEKSFTTKYDTVFYKLSEIQSWFFNNESLFGYFINDVSEQEVIKLSSYIVLPTKRYIENFVEPNISKICKQGNIFMTKIEKTNLSIDAGNLLVSFDGLRENGTIKCSLVLDLSNFLFGTIKNFSYEEVDSEEEKENLVEEKEEDSVEKGNLILDPDVSQFPLFLDKPLVFTSSRGHSISFPSPRISYKSNSVSENLDINGVNCYVATHVIEYSNREFIDTEQSLIVYECKVRENVVVPENYRSITVLDGRVFVISVLDSAWIDFGNYIEVTLN